MWGQKFGFVVGNSLGFIFSHFSKIKKIFINTFLIFGGVIFLLSLFLGEAIKNAFVYQSVMEQGNYALNIEFVGLGMGPLVNVLFLVIMTLVVFGLIPFIVGIIRAVVLDEEADASVLTSMFKLRQLRYLWATIKIGLMVLAIFIPTLLLMFALVLGAESMNMQESGAAGLALLVGAIYFASVILLLILIPRWMMAPVMAAVDKGTSLKESRHLTKGGWWLIVLSYFVVSFIATLAMYLFILLGGLVIGLLVGTFAPMVAVALGAVLILLAIMLATIPGTALFGSLYLVLTNQVQFKKPDIKKEDA